MSAKSETILNEPVVSEKLHRETIEAMRAAFEFGFRSAEKGMNLQAALEKFDKTMQ